MLLIADVLFDCSQERSRLSGKPLHQDVCGLERFCGAEGEAFFAVPALSGGYFGDEADFFSNSSIDKSYCVFLFDFCAVSDAEAAMNAKGWFFFETIPVCFVFPGEVLQYEGIGRMGKEEFQDHLSDSVYLL